MAGNIKVDLILGTQQAKGEVRDIELALRKLGFKSIQDAFGANPGLTRAIAKGVGIPIEEAIKHGVERGLRHAAFPFAAFINQSLGIGVKNTPKRTQDYYDSLFGLPKSQNYAAFLNQALGIGAGQNRPSRAGYEALWASLIPPQLVPPIPYGGKPPPVIQNGGFFSSLQGRLTSYAGGRAIANLAMGNFGGGFAGAAGVAASTGPWGAAGAIAVSASVALANAFVHLTEKMQQWAEIGAKLFQRAAKVGLSTGQTFLAQSYAQLLGVSPDQIENLLLRGQFGSGQRGGGGARGGLAASIPGLGYLAGRGPQGAGDVQQIQNMVASLGKFAEQIKETLAEDVILAQRAGGFNERVTLGFVRIQQEIEVFKMTVVQTFAPALNFMTEALTEFVHTLSILTENINGLIDKLRQNPYIQAAILGLFGGSGSPLINALGAFAGGDIAQANKRTTPLQRGTATALERMGLVIGGGHDRVLLVLEKIEQNTRSLRWGGGSFGGAGGGSSWGSDPLNLLGPPQHNTP